jgi:hypothetical protein
MNTIDAALNHERTVSRAKDTLTQALSPFTPAVRTAAMARVLYEMGALPAPAEPKGPEGPTNSPIPFVPTDTDFRNALKNGLPPMPGVTVRSRGKNTVVVTSSSPASTASPASPAPKRSLTSLAVEYIANNGGKATSKQVARAIYKSPKAASKAYSLLFQIAKKGVIERSATGWRIAPGVVV